MSTVREQLDRDRYKLIADKIMQLLDKIHDTSLSEKRWVWELLQNAKDVPNKFGRVSIKIELFPDRLEFCHNGNHFSVNNLSGLIQQVSSKDSQNQGEQTGKFGTGFITTHLLSRIINVRGVVLNPNTNKYQHFNIKLDRSAKSSEELVPVIANSIRYVEGLDNNDYVNFPIAENYESRSEDDFFTSFTYSLTPDSLSAAQIGLADLVNTLPLTMISLPKLKSVRVVDHIKNTDETYKCDSEILWAYDSCKIIGSTITIVGSSSISKHFFTYKNDTVALSVEYAKDNEGRIVLLEHRDGQPNLLRDFPLIGSDKFHFPYVLNGFRFEPTEMRDGLLLNKNEEKAQLNRSIIDEAVKATLKFNDWLLSQNVGNTYLMAASREPVPVNTWDEEYARPWIDKLQKEWRSQLLAQNLVETAEGFTSLSTLRLPDFEDKSYKHDERFYDFVIDMMKGGRLPLKSQLKKWQNVIYPEYKSWNENLKYTKTSFLEELESCGSISNLAELLGKDLMSTAQWMKDLVDFFIETDTEDAFSEYSILPDAKGNFHKIDELMQDAKEPIPTSIKEIYDILLGKDIESTLLHKSLSTCAIGRIAMFGFKDAIRSINECIEDKLSNYTSYKEDSSLWEKDIKAIFRMVNTIDPNAGVDQMGNRMRRLIQPLLPEFSNADKIENLDSAFWKTANRFVISMLPIVIDWNYSSIDSLRNDFFTDKKEESDAIGWLNLLFSLNNDAHLSIAKEIAIFPDENGAFHRLEDLHFDRSIPSEYKELDKLASNRDWNNELLHTGLNGYENHQPYDTATVYESVKRTFENASAAKKEEIALQTISLIPHSSSAKHNAVEEIYSLSKTIFGGRLPESVEISQTNGFEWEKFAAYLLDVIADRVACSTSIGNLGAKYAQEEDQVVNFVDHLIEYAETYYDRRYRGVVEEKHGVWVNQHGNFYPFKEIHADLNIPDILKNMALNKRVNHDFREELADNRFKFVKYLPQETAISVKDVLGIIDDAIKNYVDVEKGSLQQSEFTQLVLDLHAWNDAHQEDKQYTPFFNANHDRLMVGSLTEKETISLIGKLVGNKEKLAAAADLVSKLSTEEIHSLIVKKDGGKEIILMEKYDGSNTDLTNEQKQAYLEEAKDRVLEDLKNEGYDITNHDWDWTHILGVRDRNGNECPIVFRSNRSHRDTVITPADWDTLTQPNAMFGIVTSDGQVRKYKLNDLLKGTEYMTIRFSTSNCDVPERLDKLSEIFRYFGGIQFNFEKYIEPTLFRWQSFMAPELNTGELPEAGSVSSLPE